MIQIPGLSLPHPVTVCVSNVDISCNQDIKKKSDIVVEIFFYSVIAVGGLLVVWLFLLQSMGYRLHRLQKLWQVGSVVALLVSRAQTQ